MRRVTRDRRLFPEEAAKYREVREQIAGELPELIAPHQERVAALDELEALLHQLQAARESRGLSLSDLTELTGMDRSALSKLETGQRPNPTIETLVGTRRRSASGWSSRWPTLEATSRAPDACAVTIGQSFGKPPSILPSLCPTASATPRRPTLVSPTTRPNELDTATRTHGP